ncbi:MAG TPA: metallophosphoesterase [Jatrophihabitans sp.]|jgi:hypothetical protein
MTIKTMAALGLALALIAVPAASASADRNDHGSFTLAVYGDAPYGTSPTDTSEFDATPAFIDSINADPDVSTVAHVGDIHSGSQFCTESYDRSIASLWTRYQDPLVYTPGDNEWADCHKAKEGGNTFDANGRPVDYANGNPVANLALIRSIFFAHPGRTLGSNPMSVVSQAQVYDRAYPTDAQYVENVMWQRKGFLFVTVNIPGGSNNDADPWYGTAAESQQQADERSQRTGADLRWLDLAYRTATDMDAQGVVIISQADMWDLDGKTAAHLTNYEPFVSSIAAHTTAFGKPVLLFEGDSHTYRSDNPLMQGAPCTGDDTVCNYDDWNSHPSYSVANFHRVIVHGSTFPLEWLKLTVTPGGHNASTPTAFGPFTWQRMPQPTS